MPPMPVTNCRCMRTASSRTHGCDPIYRDYIGVLLSNELWRETLATIPFEKRLLLMPKCLRVESKCPAPFDEFGLLCKQCGLCTIQDFQNEAEQLGYAVLVAEGSAIVMSLIQTGKIEAIVGISCLPVLERTFPYVEAAAIPAVAVPLLQDDCIDTTVDIDWVWDYIHLTSDDKTRRLNLNALHEEVRDWFTRESLDACWASRTDKTEEIGRDWLARAGNRWRPFLTVAAYQALRDDPEGPISDAVKKAAIAVECFHKASLVHDDIEDNDATRYGEATLHAEHGMPVALNVGDLLIGEGYRLLADNPMSVPTSAPPCSKSPRKVSANSAAARAPNCSGTNNPAPSRARRCWKSSAARPRRPSRSRCKIGAALAGKLDDDGRCPARLQRGPRHRLPDPRRPRRPGRGSTADTTGLRPSLLLAAALSVAECEQGDDGEALEWRADSAQQARRPRMGAGPRRSRRERCCLLESYKEQAIRSLQAVENANLKGLLRRVIGKIFNDLEIKGWCKEFEVKNLLQRHRHRSVAGEVRTARRRDGLRAETRSNEGACRGWNHVAATLRFPLPPA